MRQKVRISTLGLHKKCSFFFALLCGVCSASAAFGCVAAVPPQKGKRNENECRAWSAIKQKPFLSEGMCQCFGIARLFFRQTHLKADAQYNRKRGAHTDGVEGKKRKFLVVRVLLRPACSERQKFGPRPGVHASLQVPKTSVVCCRCSLCAKVAAPAFNCNF